MSSSNNYNSSYNDDQAGSYNNTAGYNQQPYYDQQTYASHNGSGGGDESYNQNSQGYPSQQAGQYDFLDDPNYWSQTPAPFSYNDEAPPLTEEEIAEMQRQAETNDQSCDHTAADRVASAAYKERVDEYYRKVDEYGSQTGSRRKFEFVVSGESEITDRSEEEEGGQGRQGVSLPMLWTRVVEPRLFFETSFFFEVFKAKALISSEVRCGSGRLSEWVLKREVGESKVP